MLEYLWPAAMNQNNNELINSYDIQEYYIQVNRHILNVHIVLLPGTLMVNS